MIGQTTSFQRLRWLVVLLLSLLWATMGSAAATAERGDFQHCGIAAKAIGSGPARGFGEVSGLNSSVYAVRIC
jgi:hypothetical protein